MSERVLHGIGAEIEIAPDKARKDTAGKRRIERFARKHGYRPLLFFGIGMAALPWLPSAPAWYEALFAFGLLYAAIACVYLREKWPFRRPAWMSGNRKEGIVWLGNRIDEDEAGCWFSDSDLRTHILVFGSTGSGKTVFLLGLYYQAILAGSGIIYVDGKADNSVWWSVSALARRAGREDDLLVINYLVPPTETPDKVTGAMLNDSTRLSNTTNPFADMSPEQARSQLVGMMRSSGQGGDMWKGRASAMLGNVLAYLCAIRDKSEIILDIEYIRRAIQLPYIVAASRRTDLPEEVTTPLRRYLAELPGYDDAAIQVVADPNDPKKAPDALTVETAQVSGFEEESTKQHGFLLMQLTEVLSDLTDTYAHIFKTPLGEVDFSDVVFNRRILFVMLPALQADPDRLAGLGKLVVSGIRTALGGRALGTEIEGDRRTVIEMKPTHAQVPFFVVLDEYGYYAVPGFAVVAAQARSLGCSVVFAGQDYAGFKRNDEKEAESVIANTNIKLAMKLEDPEATYEMIRKRGGAAFSVQSNAFKKDGSAMKEEDTASVQRIDRIDLRDLVNQAPGQAHLIQADRIERISVCYVRPEVLAEEQLESELSAFLPVRDLTTRQAIDMVREKTSAMHFFAGVEHVAAYAEPPNSPIMRDFMTMTENIFHRVSKGAGFMAMGLSLLEAKLFTADFMGSDMHDEDEEEDETPQAQVIEESMSGFSRSITRSDRNQWIDTLREQSFDESTSSAIRKSTRRVLGMDAEKMESVTSELASALDVDAEDEDQEDDVFDDDVNDDDERPF